MYCLQEIDFFVGIQAQGHLESVIFESLFLGPTSLAGC